MDGGENLGASDTGAGVCLLAISGVPGMGSGFSFLLGPVVLTTRTIPGPGKKPVWPMSPWANGPMGPISKHSVEEEYDQLLVKLSVEYNSAPPCFFYLVAGLLHTTLREVSGQQFARL